MKNVCEDSSFTKENPCLDKEPRVVHDATTTGLNQRRQGRKVDPIAAIVAEVCLANRFDHG